MATRKRAKSLEDITRQRLRIGALAIKLGTPRAYNRALRAYDISDKYRDNIVGTRSQKNLLKKTVLPMSQTYGTIAAEGYRKKYTGYQNASTTRALSNG